MRLNRSALRDLVVLAAPQSAPNCFLS